ncbi:MAG: peptide deformylase [Devosiaceae bacterium]|nr:peptide deformylase [Devosiaceae bacterium]
MTFRDIILIPDKRLKTVVEPLANIDKDTHILVDDMFETMYEAEGYGLAGPQIGVMGRIIVVDCAKEDKGEKPDPIAMINPDIVFSSEEISVYEEGCLSIPEYFEEVERPANIRVKYLNIDGKTIEREADGLLATCIQHEIDHLNGKLFIDYISRLKRDRIIKKFQKLARQNAG